MTKKATIYATGERGVYVGRLERRFRRTSASATLLVSLEDELEVCDPVDGARLVGLSFLVPPGSQLEFDTHGANVALFFWMISARILSACSVACTPLRIWVSNLYFMVSPERKMLWRLLICCAFSVRRWGPPARL